MRREFMQRLLVALHGTLDSFLRDALQEGGADAVACFSAFLGLSSFLLFAWWSPLLFLVRFSINYCDAIQ
jgi:hypothetical protein